MIHLSEPLVFVTGNLNKVLWTERYIHVPLTHKKLELIEIQSLDSRVIVTHKAKQAFEIIKKPVLVEDTSLIINDWGNLPGTFIKFFLEELGNEKICNLLQSTDRLAIAKVVYGLYDGKSLEFCESEQHGTIAKAPIGSNGFGWNPIFIPQGETRSYAQLTDLESDDVSIRKIALLKLKEIINYEE